MKTRQSTLTGAAILALLLPLLPAPTPARASDRDRCEPLKAGAWAEKCMTREGRQEIEDLLPGCRRHATFADLRSVRDACEILLMPDKTSSMCDRAKRQLLATFLNWASGRIGPDCCLDWKGRETRLGDVIRRHDEDCDARRNCDEVRDFLASANNPAALHPCRPSPPPPPPPPGPDGCCSPRSKGFWHRQCLGIGALDPGKGKGKGPGIHPAFTEEELRRILARADRRLARFQTTACEALDEDNYRTARGRALAQMAALVLSYEAGFLDGCNRDRIEKEWREIARLFDAGRYEEAKALAEHINLGQSVKRCEGDREDDQGDKDKERDKEKEKHKEGDEDDDHPGKGHAYGKDKKK